MSQPTSPRHKKLKGPGGLSVASPVMDPGHLLTKLNGEAAPKRCKRHEFSLETCLGPTIFHRTKVCFLHAPTIIAAAMLYVGCGSEGACNVPPCLISQLMLQPAACELPDVSSAIILRQCNC